MAFIIFSEDFFEISYGGVEQNLDEVYHVIKEHGIAVLEKGLL